ncbi:MAG: hypothetical protein ABR498_01770, partial [Candidatus Dormibacteria bacterium]
EYDIELARPQRVTVAVQVNGKVRAQLEVDAGTSSDELSHAALLQPRVREMLRGAKPRKVVAVVDRIVNVVI